jgi:hypothetical protein
MLAWMNCRKKEDMGFSWIEGLHVKQSPLENRNDEEYQTPNQPRAAFLAYVNLNLWINASQRLAQLVNLVVFVL